MTWGRGVGEGMGAARIRACGGYQGLSVVERRAMKCATKYPSGPPLPPHPHPLQ